MGFTLVVEELIKAKKPVVGHNMIYDIIYLYNQFIGDLPLTYIEFIQEWYSRFPSVYDNKVLSSAAEYFGRTDLGKVYEKCTNDERIKNAGCKIVFDVENGFKNYEGSELLSHYHEAAYDAFMTGLCFANILKFKEFDKGKPQPKSAAAKEEEKKQEADPNHMTVVTTSSGATAAPTPSKLNFEHIFATKHFNRVMLNTYTMEFYNLNPSTQEDLLSGDKDFSKIVWVQMQESASTSEQVTADRLAQLFDDYGDFNIFKDSQSTFFMEFYYLEEGVVPTQTVDEFIRLVNQDEVAKKLGVKAVVPYKDANKFKAHNRLE